MKFKSVRLRTPHLFTITYYLFTARVQTKFCTNIAQSPGARNSMVSTIVSIPGSRNKCIRSGVNSPLKKWR